MHILVTNDDGVQAPGLLALAREMRKLGRATVFAPDRNWSASGHVKTLHKPLRVTETKLPDGTRAFATSGAPSDCVALALLGFVKEKVDLVVSGINPHANLGQDVTYSGTVTAAMEAAIAGTPGIAVSMEGGSSANFGTAAKIAAGIVQTVIRYGLPPKTLLNVNIPLGPDIKGIRITRQGWRIYRDVLVERLDPRARPYYWIGGEAPTGIAEDEGTDFWALAQGYVSVTPLQLDLTAREAMPVLEKWEFQLP